MFFGISAFMQLCLFVFTLVVTASGDAETIARIVEKNKGTLGKGDGDGNDCEWQPTPNKYTESIA